MEHPKLRLTKPWLSAEETQAATTVLQSGYLVEGEQTHRFEEELTRTVGAKYAIAVCNCTVALTLALKAHRVLGRVAIPDFTHPATALAVLNAGAEPILYDVSLTAYNMVDSEESTSVPVSWAGNPLVKFEGTVIEDAACSIGIEDIGKEHTCCFSFHPRKLVTTGEGGAVTTNDANIAERVRQLKNFGYGGGNYRLNDIASAIGLAQLKKLPAILQRRREMARIYTELLQDNKLIVPPKQDGGTYQTYAVYLKKGSRDKTAWKLAESGIETQIGTYALHMLPVFKGLPQVGDLENSQLLHLRLLSLPMAYDLTEEDQKFVITTLSNTINS